MINSKPNNKNYNSGNYIPKNKDKVLKLNNEGGVYFRSGWEKQIMVWLDCMESIVQWGAECMEIPYQKTHFNNGDVKLKSHRYYPDFFYKMLMPDNSIKYVVMEVKPQKEYQMVLNLIAEKMVIPTENKKLKNFEYDLKMAYSNKQKWETMIEWCNKKGYEFIVVTEVTMKKKGIIK